ncbi:host-nuclease inhibitor Gam family protein [Chitiniphilus shinanonensis]|uniref:host-nuclease inhibitor Gam family protein n=1 Tax=Chitiniphilus shinanonensis TaxID=553088 RepID=UPI003024469E
MARKRVETPTVQLQSWDEVDGALAKIGEINRKLARLEARTNEHIDRIKADAVVVADPLLAQRATLELAMKAFAEANRAEFASSKTKVLTFGEVSFRLSTKVQIKRIGDTLQALHDLQLTHCIRTKEEIDKDALKKLDSATLVNIGASLKTENTFGYEVRAEDLVEA